jgi:hypothetical protein
VPNPIEPSAVDPWERAQRASRVDDEHAPRLSAKGPTTLDEALARIADAPTSLCPGAFARTSAPPPAALPVFRTETGDNPLRAAPDAVRGVRPAALVGALPDSERTSLSHTLAMGDYRLHPAVDEHDAVLYYAAFNTKTRRVEYIVGPDATATFRRDPDGLAHAAALTFAHGAPTTKWQLESMKTVDAMMNEGPSAGIDHLGQAWGAAVRDPNWWGEVIAGQAVGVGVAGTIEALEARAATRAMARSELATARAGGEAKAAATRYEPTVTADASLPAGEGRTDKFGNAKYSPHGTPEQVALVKAHESVHSFLSPKALNGLRELRADVGMKAYAKSQLCRYIEEALAESYAQVQVNGLRALPEGLKFPVTHGYVTVSRVIGEAAIGTIAYGGIVYGAYVVVEE